MEEIRRFAQTTSMKGVPRMVRADPGLLRLMWTLAVLGFLGISLYQTTVLVSDYLDYDHVTQVSEVVWDPFSMVQGSALPDINLCNLNPLSSNSSRAEGVPSLSEYYTLVLEETNCTKYHEDRLEEVEALRQNLLTLEGYYRYIGRENAFRVGHTIDDMILSCHIYVVDGINKRKVPCRDNVHFSYFQTSLYFNCVNFVIDPKLTSTGVVGLSLVLFLDNLQEDSGEGFNQQAETGLSAGVILGIQGRQSLPSLTMNTIEVPPGYKADIRLTPEKRSRLPPPHGKCTPGARDFLQGVGNTGVPLPFRYSYPSCLLICLEGHVLEECGCVSGRDADLNLYQNLSVDYCGSVRRGWQHALLTTNCSHRVRDSSIKSCLQGCPYPCTDYYYTLGSSQAQWPIRSRMVGFYNHFIRDKPFARHFSIFEDISKDALQGQLKNTDPRYAVATELIRQNFLDVSISIKDYRFISLNENVKTSIEALISQLGGTLNLWSGISAIIMIEILELIYRLWAFVCRRREEDVENDTPVEFNKGTTGDKQSNTVI